MMGFIHAGHLREVLLTMVPSAVVTYRHADSHEMLTQWTASDAFGTLLGVGFYDTAAGPDGTLVCAKIMRSDHMELVLLCENPLLPSVRDERK